MGRTGGTTQVVGVGAGGHARVVTEILRALDGYEVVALVDPKPELWGTTVLGIPVVGDDSLLPELRRRGVRHAFIGVGSSGDTGPRRRAYERVRLHGFEVVRAIHPLAVLAPSVEIGLGPTIMAGAIINAAARLGENVLINTGAIVEHDCRIGDHVHVATGARLAGAVEIEEGAHIGLAAAIRQRIRIGKGAVVGAGAVVVDDVSDGVVVAGVPARPLRDAPR
ncbi:MAG: acetyltransferase [Candidatus Rokubacteria bacterium]|nr:acetyltransferase [Candidatus Rokubacteria bacterium]